MHRPLKFATLIAVAVAFTACADSLPRGITEPDGLRSPHLSGSVSPALDDVFHKAEGLLNQLYACAGDKQIANKNNDLNDIGTAAAAGKWDQVVAGVARLIKATDGLIAKTKGDNIPASCPPSYADETERAALRDEVVLWLNVFANQGEYQGDPGEGGAFNCPSGGCDVQTTGPNGFGATVPDGTFGDNDVIIVFTPYTPGIANSVGNRWNIDVNGFSGAAFEAWTRWICWDGSVGETDLSPNPDYIVMVRGTEDGPDYLPTEWQDGRCAEPTVLLNPILRGAYKLFAGLPFLPSEAIAYSPPRTFGGTSTASSPHWLEVIPPPPAIDNAALNALCQKTYEYSPATANAACTHLDRAAESETDADWNDALDQFIGVINAQTGKNDLSVAEANELIQDANNLKRGFLGIWNGRLTSTSSTFSQPITVIVTSEAGATVAGDYRVALDCSPEPCDPVLYNTNDRFFTGQVDGTTMTFTLAPFVSVDSAVVTLTRSGGSLAGTHNDWYGGSITNSFTAALTLGTTATVVAPTANVLGGPNLNVLAAPSAEGSNPRGAGLR